MKKLREDLYAWWCEVRAAWELAQDKADSTDQIDPDLDALHNRLCGIVKQLPPPNLNNVYAKHFSAFCPINGEEIFYTLTILSGEIVKVEDIDECLDHIEDIICSDYGPGLMAFHEQIADMLHESLGNLQILEAHHHGTDIRTIRG